ncbi:Dipeptide/oligopeptide ABC transporter, ATPase component [Acidilobus saccharovorans 345-15]|uniref:Dipeptide/oligopeptide ABC transporter, ATPase component n=1 Tax=Acidilobus saccharovorans (strain DSM 16705 / JCM 18335 / VKM B-2471 / 345-15) TaxID=666510 RepID=D9Q2V3_ACIS3|nr:ABC transporter ATP-binding protein [Acidilobus saccharovorans]ADL19641.1 Dipeptide/oligopeptide ABC transporter, ATPase component [Acidilobus saccharovorans 345-15]
MPPLLKVENLKIYFHMPRGYVRAVDEVSLELNEGEIIGVAGESGSGKSTLALGIMRLIMPPGFIEGGNVYFEGNEILHLPEKVFNSEYRWKRIAMVFQGSMNGFTPVYRIRDQIKEVLEVHGYTGDPDQRVNELMKMVNLDPSIADRYPHELSGGQRQRAFIAMALALNPKVLLADEPTTALDVITQTHIINLLKQLKKELNLSILFITHDLALMSMLADRIYVMYAGRIVEHASTENIVKNAKHPYTKLLMESVPDLSKDYVKGIPGSMPDLARLPPGCRFSTRCPFVMDRCRAEEPKLRRVGENDVACWLY